jgi:putative transcriptional regulator
VIGTLQTYQDASQANHKGGGRTLAQIGLEQSPAPPHVNVMENKTDMNFTGKLLIAMPGMEDPRFESAVILICSHSSDGAMGLIINKPASDLKFKDLLDRLGIPYLPEGRGISVHFGGPVDRGRGFVLHSPDYSAAEGTLRITPSFGMTATQDILRALGRGQGPETALLALGYAGWGPGQLEAEIQRNDWLSTDAPADLVFGTEAGMKWATALRQLGVEPVALSTVAGHA